MRYHRKLRDSRTLIPDLNFNFELHDRVMEEIRSPIIESGEGYDFLLRSGRCAVVHSITADGPCRLLLYGSAEGKVLDAGRGYGSDAAAHVPLLMDLQIDAAPYARYPIQLVSNVESPAVPQLYGRVVNLMGGHSDMAVQIWFSVIEP